MSKPLPIDHVAVPSNDIKRSVTYYSETFGGKVLYQDDTWAFLQMGDVKLAIVTPSEHPPHVALRVSADELERRHKETGATLDTHRDGTKGLYLKDPDGNAVELICYPEGDTPYND